MIGSEKAYAWSAIKKKTKKRYLRAKLLDFVYETKAPIVAMVARKAPAMKKYEVSMFSYAVYDYIDSANLLTLSSCSLSLF